MAFLFVAIFLRIEENSFAQDPFFEKDYAKNPLSDQSESSEQIHRIQPTSPSETRNPKTKDQSLDLTNTPQGEKVGGISETDDILDAVKVYKISLIVNGYDISHLTSTVDALLSFIRDKKILIDNVWINGSQGSGLALMSYFLKQGWNALSLSNIGKVQGCCATLPEQYRNISTSPAYILSTNKGEIIVEGEKDISNILSSQGTVKSKFLLPAE